ncbi:MAG: multiheme c-type cytochrome [Gemmatimonadota bacterium]
MRWPAFRIDPLPLPGGRRTRKALVTIVVAVASVGLLYGAFRIGYPAALRWYTGDKISTFTYANEDHLTDAQFETLANRLEQQATSRFVDTHTGGKNNAQLRAENTRLLANLRSTREKAGFSHIDYFREAGIRTYEGPQTCLRCHEDMTVHKLDGGTEKVHTMDDVMNSVHYRLFSKDRNAFSTYGYNGVKVNSGRPIPVGKIDRACGIPGSFTWTGWAALIKAKPEGKTAELRSEGCGQCHIGGGYGPPSEEMMPVVVRDKRTENGIDCLICHSRSYDMNQRYVIDDGVGLRWNQDRSMKAAMTVGRPTSQACLRCHQHDMGGDTYPYNEAAHNLGYEHKRLLHPDAKRGTPFAPESDVHAAAGMSCLDCHVSVGHKIARGRKGVDLVSNDLPNVDVSCVGCHTSSPHVANPAVRAILNGHTARVACETCHITRLWQDNVVLIDWLNPQWNAEEGIYVPQALYQTGDMSKAVDYLWLNGNGTFLANALGTNPTGDGDYDPLMKQITRYDKDSGLSIPGIENNDFLSQLNPEMLARRRQMVKKDILPLQAHGTSKIYPFKVFNARMYEDMNNQGPFGAMILPFDYTTYFETGDALASVKKAVANPMVKRMYQKPFKYYMMDKFMEYFGVGSWATRYPLKPQNQDSIQGHWMRQMGTLMINHGITRQARTCDECHRPNGLLDFRALGYGEQRAYDLEHLPELKMLHRAGASLPAASLKPGDRQITARNLPKGSNER